MKKVFVYVLLFTAMVFGIDGTSRHKTFDATGSTSDRQVTDVHLNAMQDTVVAAVGRIVDTLNYGVPRWSEVLHNHDSTFGYINADTIAGNPIIDSIQGGTAWVTDKIDADTLVNGDTLYSTAAKVQRATVDTLTGLDTLYSTAVRGMRGRFDSVGVGIAPTRAFHVVGVVGNTSNNAQLAYLSPTWTAVTSDGSHYYKGISVIEQECAISAGMTDDGYRVGVDGQVFISDANFQGTLDEQYGGWFRAGTSTASPTGTIDEARGVYAEILYGANSTINTAYGVYIQNAAGPTNNFGLYQTLATAKNYFAGSVGIATTSPSRKLHVVGGIDADTLTGAALVSTTIATVSDSLFADTAEISVANINGGAIDGAVIGASSAAAATFTTVNTGQGANELYAMNQDVETTDAVTFATVNTGQGANELYDMDQNVTTTSDVIFDSVSARVGVFDSVSVLHTGAFPCTLTGVVEEVIDTVRYQIIGNMAMVHIPAMAGTSNSGSKTLNGWPEHLQIEHALAGFDSSFHSAEAYPIRTVDNSTTYAWGRIGIYYSDEGFLRAVLLRDAVGNVWTSSGQAGVFPITITYMLRY